MRSRGPVIAALAACFVFALASPAWAEKGDMRLQFGFVFGMPTDDLVDLGQTTEADDAFGFQASFEYGVTEAIGVEPAISTAGHDLTVIEPGFADFDLGDLDFVALTANVNFHVMRDKRVDLKVGPTIGYVFWGDLESDLFPEDLPADDEFVYGLNVGVDVPFGEGSWGFSAALNYLFS